MAWTRLGDQFTDAARNLSDAAFRLHVESLVWSNRRKLGLKIPKDDLQRFTEVANPYQATKELIKARWWWEGPDHFEIGLRFAGWQKSARRFPHITTRPSNDRTYLAELYALREAEDITELAFNELSDEIRIVESRINRT